MSNLPPTCARTPGRPSGIGLIEVLVALLVLSIGFLVAARMQVQGLSDSQSAYHRTQALLLVGDMMDRMRNNPTGVAAGHYDGKTTGSRTAPDCADIGCNAQQVSKRDLYDWSAQLQPLGGASDFVPVLPAESDTSFAKGSISAPVAGVYTLAMSWKEAAGGEGTREASVSVRFVP